MPDFRCFCHPDAIRPDAIHLDPGESHHLVNVNRARQGDPVVAFDGRGREWECELVNEDRKAAVLRPIALHEHAPLPYSLTLAQALPKGKIFDSIVRRATEIGAARLVPMLTQRTEVRLEDKGFESKRKKWIAGAVEAAKQSGNPFVPEIAPPRPLENVLEEAREYDCKLVASLETNALPLRNRLSQYQAEDRTRPFRLLWLVGPEGDFTTDELRKIETYGFLPVNLGPYVLRTETAAIAALAIASYELQALNIRKGP